MSGDPKGAADSPGTRSGGESSGGGGKEGLDNGNEEEGRTGGGEGAPPKGLEDTNGSLTGGGGRLARGGALTVIETVGGCETVATGVLTLIGEGALAITVPSSFPIHSDNSAGVMKSMSTIAFSVCTATG